MCQGSVTSCVKGYVAEKSALCVSLLADARSQRCLCASNAHVRSCAWADGLFI